MLIRKKVSPSFNTFETKGRILFEYNDKVYKKIWKKKKEKKKKRRSKKANIELAWFNLRAYVCSK